MARLDRPGGLGQTLGERTIVRHQLRCLRPPGDTRQDSPVPGLRDGWHGSIDPEVCIWVIRQPPASLYKLWYRFPLRFGRGRFLHHGRG